MRHRAHPPRGRPKGAYQQTVKVLRMVRFLTARRWTAEELAQELGINKRTVYRHLARLEEAGYPMERARDADGQTSYRLPRGHDGIPPLTLSPEELLSLYLAKRHVDSWRGTPFSEDLDTIFNRIKAEQPDRTANHIERIVTAFYPLVRPVRDYAAKWEILVRLREALLRQFRVLLRHQVPGAEGPVEHLVEPYVLVAHNNGLYLIGHSARAGAIRHFAVERLQAVQVTSERFDMPADFEAGNLDHRLFGIFAGPPVPVRIRFSPDAAYLVKERQFHPTQTLREHEDGSVELRMTAGGLEEIASWVLSWGEQAKVLAPRELVDLVRARLTATANQYRMTGRRT